MKKAIFNRETLKLELYFDKADYTSLNSAEKDSIKSNYLWSNRAGCWVSRAKEPNLYSAKEVAARLGFPAIEKEGERLTFAEQVEQQSERAAERAERYEARATAATHKAEQMQKPLTDMSGDIAFFTQPNVNTSAGRSFTNQRRKMYERYERGIDEYRKSEYYRERAATAQNTAEASKYNDVAYLDRRIKETKKSIAYLYKNLDIYGEYIKRLEAGKELKMYDGTPITYEQVNEWGTDTLERIESLTDKLAFLLNKVDECGGIRYSKDNIKAGYIVVIPRWGKCKVISAGKVNIKFKTLFDRSIGIPLTAAYAEITEIVSNEGELK